MPSARIVHPTILEGDDAKRYQERQVAEAIAKTQTRE